MLYINLKLILLMRYDLLSVLHNIMKYIQPKFRPKNHIIEIFQKKKKQLNVLPI